MAPILELYFFFFLGSKLDCASMVTSLGIQGAGEGTVCSEYILDTATLSMNTKKMPVFNLAKALCMYILLWSM